MEPLDNVDKTILKHLQENAKITTKELASLLNLTISPIYERIKRLETLNYIQQYVAILNRNLLEKRFTTICQVSMLSHDEYFIERFEHEVQLLEEVQECYHVSGQIDFLLKIAISSPEEYHLFVKNKLSKMENIGTLNSAFILKEIKYTHAFKLEI